MAKALRSVVVAGAAIVTVGASALSTAPAVEAEHRQVVPVSPAYSLTALPSPLPISRSAPIELGSLEPEVLELVEATSINSAIKNIYNAVEPWVAWGFDVAEYVVGWIPVAGWFAPQITMLYDFGEAIVRSVVFNVDDWLFGPLPFFQGLRNVISDTWDASWNLLWNEVNWLLPPLPPLPPIPPCPQWLCGPAVADATLAVSAVQPGTGEQPWESLVSMLRFQADAAHDLTQSVGGALASFAQDLVETGGQAVADFFEHGLITAVANALGATWDSLVVRSGQALDGFTEYFDAQKEYFTAEPAQEDAETVSENEESVALVGSSDSGVDDRVSSLAADGKSADGQSAEVDAVVPEAEPADDSEAEAAEPSEDAGTENGRPGSEPLDDIGSEQESGQADEDGDTTVDEDADTAEQNEESGEQASDTGVAEKPSAQDDAADAGDATDGES